MKRFLLAFLTALCLFGCGQEEGSGGPSSPPSSSPKPLAMVGYGVPNACHSVDAEAMGDALVEAGLGLTVCESMPWFTGEGRGCKHNGGLSDETFPAQTAAFIEAMRARGITTVLMGVNANNCEVKQIWDDSDFSELNSWVGSVGPRLVWYLPVNEPWQMDRTRASSWNSIARNSYGGQFLVADSGRNHRNGLPFFSVPHDLRTVNACSLETAFDSLGADTLVTTDCSPVLNPGPTAARELARAAHEQGAPFVVYDFRARTPDYAVIRAMGEGVGE